MMNNIFLFKTVLGDNYCLSDLINDMKDMKERNDIMINRLYDILSYLNYDPEDIAFILHEDVSSSLQFIIDILNNLIS